jgi:hypothetical protein
MSVRRVQVQGCLPALLALVVVGALVAAVAWASLAFLVVAIVAGLVAAVVRRLRRLIVPGEEKTPGARHRAADVTIDAEVVERPEGGGDRPPKRLE